MFALAFATFHPRTGNTGAVTSFVTAANAAVVRAVRVHLKEQVPAAAPTHASSSSNSQTADVAAAAVEYPSAAAGSSTAAKSAEKCAEQSAEKSAASAATGTDSAAAELVKISALEGAFSRNRALRRRTKRSGESRRAKEAAAALAAQSTPVVGSARPASTVL